MQVQVLQEDLLKILNSSIHFINIRSTLPILSNFLLETQKTKLKIKATNLEMSTVSSIGAKVEEEGSITIPAKTFYEIIANLNQGQLTLSLEKENLKIIGDNFSSTIPTIPPNDFPSIPENIDKKEKFTLSSQHLKDALSKVLFAASGDAGRPVLNGVLFLFSENNLDLVATDGFRLSKKKVNIAIKNTNHIIIPRASLQEIIRQAADDLIFQFKNEENQLIVKIGESYLSTRLIDGNFPDFEKIIPTSSSTKVTISKNDLLKAVKLSSVFARESSDLLKIKVEESTIEITSEGTKTGRQKSRIDALIIGPSLEISFNYKFIEDFLNVVEGESVEINLNDPTSPAIFIDPKDPDFLHLIMPVRVQS